MFVIWKKLADWFCSQGKKHANLKSVRGSYEDHLREMNHSPRFWQELDRTTDGKGRELRRRMREFSRQLFKQTV